MARPCCKHPLSLSPTPFILRVHPESCWGWTPAQEYWSGVPLPSPANDLCGPVIIVSRIYFGYTDCAKIWWFKRIHHLSCFYVSGLEQTCCCVHRSCLGPHRAGSGAGARDTAPPHALFLWFQITARISLNFFTAR